MGMTAFDMTAMAGMDGRLMQRPTWSTTHAALMASMWLVMMVAMMLPSAMPVLLLYAKLTRSGNAYRRPLFAASLFALGYFVAWGFFSVVATAAQWGLESARLLSPMLEASNVWLGSAILLAAGLWQLTPLKQVCLRHCRSPLGFLLGHWYGGGVGALRMGARHGLYCLGCCWFLMALLFFGGVMNLYWILGLTLFVAVEKLAQWGPGLGRVAGVLLVLWGLALPLI